MPTIGDMTTDIRTNNIAKGHRPAGGGPGSNTLGDYIALAHTEIAEATEAFRDWRLEDRTERVAAANCEVGLGDQPVKPLGVGSELADLLIRLLDMVDVFQLPDVDLDFELGDLSDLEPADSDPALPPLVTFGDHMAWLHRRIDQIWGRRPFAAAIALRALVTVARKYDIDLEFEYRRKHAYNLTRPYRHGGRALAETGS